MRFFPAVILLFCIRLPLFAVLLQGDYVGLTITYADQSTVLVRLSVSGSQPAVQFALDADTGQLRWKHILDAGGGYASFCDEEQFLQIEGAFLRGRSFSDGKVLWSKNLSDLPWVSDQIEEGVWNRWFGRVNHYDYNLTSLKGDGYAISRIGLMADGGCCITQVSSDWVLLAGESLRAVKFGEGEILSVVGDALLVEKGRTLLQVDAKRTRNLTGILESKFPEGFHLSRAFSAPDADICSFQVAKRGEGSMVNHWEQFRVIYDLQKNDLKIVPLGFQDGLRTEWWVDDHILLRYADHFTGPAKERSVERRWVQAFDFEGEAKATVWLPEFPDDAESEQWTHLSCLGSLPSEEVVFLEKSERRGVLHVLQKSPLQERKRFHLQFPDNMTTRYELQQGGISVLETVSPGLIQNAPAVPYERTMVVRMISLEDGKVLWEYHDKVHLFGDRS